jgi:hypothetical protein
MSPNLDRARLRAHKEMAHLTYDRLAVTPEGKPWSFIQLQAEITAVFHRFFLKVPKDRLAADWQAVRFETGSSTG